MSGLNSDQNRAPIYDMARRYVEENTVRFHMPGHKGRLYGDDAADLAQDMWQMDITELPDTDDLHMPQGAIMEAQRLMAEAYGADRSFLMVNGSTGGIYAMMLAACKPGDSIVVARNCHKSVINGLILAGLNPIYIWPPMLQDWHITGQIRPEQVGEALEQHPEAVAVLITSPDYYGLCADVAGIAGVCHQRGVPLLVDEAHGAHFAFHESLPPSAGHCGADIWVNSMHKTLPALTQTAVLHVRSRMLDTDRVRAGLQMAQTTSPSYILMASMDMARRYMANEGRSDLNNLLGYIADLSQWLCGMGGVRMMDGSIKGRSGVTFKDPTRLCLDISGLGIGGVAAEELLRAEGVQAEMADLYNVVFITTVMDNAKDFAVLKEALIRLAASGRNAKEVYHPPVMTLPHPVQTLSPRQAALGAAERVSLEDAAGRIAAQPIGLYPPGIPAVCPGEFIDRDTIEVLLEASARVGRVFNMGEDKMVAVVREKAYE